MHTSGDDEAVGVLVDGAECGVDAGGQLRAGGGGGGQEDASGKELHLDMKDGV